MRKLVFSILIFLFIFISNTKAGIIINEVLVNEPGGYTTLEWFELYNDSRGSESLDDYKFHIGSKIIAFESGLIMEAGAYQIFCRELYTVGTKRGFEDYWGDSSFVWGNTKWESKIDTPIVIGESFSFTNASGEIELYDNNDILVSEFVWTSSGLDGYSWERFSPLSDVIEQSVDNIGSSPGYINSITPVPNDLAVELIDINRLDGFTNISLIITNVGTNTVSDATLQVNEIVNDLVVSPLETLSIPELLSQEIYTVTRSYNNLFIYYTTLEIELSSDDRLNNNEMIFIAPGSDFPPVILTEILANPTSSLNSEWVEIYNRSPYTFDISGILLGDSLHAYLVTDISFLLQPDEYLILAEDSINFSDYYSIFNGDVIEPDKWASLNNGSDKVRLIDQYGLELDHFSYKKIHPDNQTWGRGSDVLHQDDWGVSELAGGTPGEENHDVYFSPTGSNVNFTLDPKIISPDGDGIDEFTTITVEAPSEHEYKLKIYDKQGREVYSFDRVRDENEWSGTNNTGGRLPIGIYIVYLEVVGMESTKQPIVIAR